MKLLDILKEIISETIEDKMGLGPTHNLSDLVNNLSIISGQSGNKRMVNIWAMDYIMNYPDLVQPFKTKYKIEKRDDFEKFMSKLQIKARKDVNKDKKLFRVEFERQKELDFLSKIEKMALDAEDEMQKKIANKYK